MTPFWRPASGGVDLAVKVQPKSRRPGLQGTTPAIDGVRLRIGVTEAAEGGRANRAACETLADALGLPRSSVAVRAGHTSREKILHIQGDPAALATRLEAL